jgi:hypothetical protein
VRDSLAAVHNKPILTYTLSMMAMFARICFALSGLPAALAVQEFRSQSMIASASAFSIDAAGAADIDPAYQWVRIYQIKDGDKASAAFPVNTAAVGDIGSAVGSSHAKLSDADINALAATYDGYTHVYKILSSGTPSCATPVFVRTADAYVDTQAAWGFTRTNSQIGIGSSYEDITNAAGWGVMSSNFHGMDLANIFHQGSAANGWNWGALSGQSCCRSFTGYSGADCYGGTYQERCLTGGSQCLDSGGANHAKLQGVVMYILADASYSGPGSSSSLSSGSSSSSGAATGDPHLQNVYGQRFDLLKPGRHVLINIPRFVRAEEALIRVEAEARQLGGRCEDMYFQALNITGAWAEKKQAGGYHYESEGGVDETPGWMALAQVELKVVHGHTQQGVKYLNFYVRHLGRMGLAVGGLLGEDDHSDAAKPPESCRRELTLGAGHDRSSRDVSAAAASL